MTRAPLQRFGIGAALLALLVGFYPAAAHEPGLTLSGRGTAVIDGLRSPGEWDGAGTYSFAARLPDGGMVPASLHVMNDAANLYLAVQVVRPAQGALGGVLVIFDVNHNGEQDWREDVVLLTPSWSVGSVLLDNVWLEDDGILLDTRVGGTSDSQGRIGESGGLVFAEIARPLQSRDQNDGRLRFGRTVGFMLTVQWCDVGRCMNTYVPPNPTSFARFADILLADPRPTTATSAQVSPLLPPGLTTAQPNPGTSTVTDSDQCRRGGWREHGFRNQGQCIRAVVGHRGDDD